MKELTALLEGLERIDEQCDKLIKALSVEDAHVHNDIPTEWNDDSRKWQCQTCGMLWDNEDKEWIDDTETM